MKRVCITFFLIFMFSVNGVSAQETPSNELPPLLMIEDLQWEEEYEFPVIKPEFSIFGGYRFVDLSGSERAGEFEYLHDSISFGGDLRIVSYPHRFHLDLDYRNEKDRFGDLWYTYKDIVLFRAIDSTLFHNLENMDLDPSGTETNVDIRDAGRDYSVEVGIRNILLRLKTPGFPFHFYVDGGFIEKEGRMQQRSLLGSAYFNDRIRSSQSRDIDWETKDITVGANSHLGPVEVDFSHGEKRFDVGGDVVLSDTYTSAGFGPPGTVRFGGTYPHNLVPELESSTNTLKIHTSHTGQLVASATFSKTDIENRESNAEADYFVGSGGVAWMPLPRLTLLATYRHKDADIDNSDITSLSDLCSPSNNNTNTYTCEIRPSVSSVTDTVSGTVRYRPASKLMVKAKYTYEDIRREDYEEWNLPRSTQKNTITLSAYMRVVKGLKLTTNYTHKNISSPAYNIDPDSSDEGRISISWIPQPRLNTLLSYSRTEEERDDLHFADTDEADSRDVTRDRLMGSITFLVLNNLSLTTSYSYYYNKTEQDIEFHDVTGQPFIDSSVPYKDEAHNYTVDIQYMPKNNLDLGAGISHTLSKGSFKPDEPDLLEPVSIASFSKLKIKETVYSFRGEYRFKGGFASGVQYRYTNFNDSLNNPFDDVDDGKAQIILLTLTKKW